MTCPGRSRPGGTAGHRDRGRRPGRGQQGAAAGGSGANSDDAILGQVVIDVGRGGPRAEYRHDQTKCLGFAEEDRRQLRRASKPVTAAPAPGRLDRSAIAPLPANVRAAAFLPHGLLLPMVDVM